MDTLDKLLQISSRLEHLENAADWITRETVHSDSGVSQTGTLITVLADELREMVYNLVHELEQEKEAEEELENETFH